MTTPQCRRCVTDGGVSEWQALSDEGLRLRLGELTAQEIRAVRAVLRALCPRPTDVGRRCACKPGHLSRCLTRIARKCTAAETAALDMLWERMEAAETDWDWLNAKAQDGEPIELGGRIYVPKQPNDPR